MEQIQETPRKKKKPSVLFSDENIFPLPDRADDFELNLDEEVAKYKAAKGQAGNHGFGGDGIPNIQVTSVNLDNGILTYRWRVISHS